MFKYTLLNLMWINILDNDPEPFEYINMFTLDCFYSCFNTFQAAVKYINNN